MRIANYFTLSGLLFLCLSVLLYGQIIFQFINFHFHIVHISLPFILLLYLVSILKSLLRIRSFILRREDIYIFIFFIYVICSFITRGNSNKSEFWIRIIFVMIGPYLIGRLLGSIITLKSFNYFLVIYFLNLLVFVFEIVNNPNLLIQDRFLLYGSQEEFGSGGSTQGFVSVIFGSALMIATNSNGLWPNDIYRKFLLIVSAVFLLLFGSRSSLVASFFAILIAYFMGNKLSFISIFRIVVTFIFALGVFFIFVPASRQNFFNEAFNGEGSAAIRGMLLIDAWNLIQLSPVVGIGASNFGYLYSFEMADFASPHSFFVQIVTELGFLGLFLFLVLVSHIFKKVKPNFKIKRLDNLNNIGLIVFVLWLFLIIDMQFYGNMFYDYQLYVFTGILISVIYKNFEGTKIF